MEEALDPDDLEVGADTSVLIDLAEGKTLPGLQELFSAVALPGQVKRELERGNSPFSAGILRSSWLVLVTAEDPEDLQFISDLHRNLGSSPPTNAGEAELIALANRHDWIAIIEDRAARSVAIAEGIRVTRLTGLAAAAAACGVITSERAWGLHRGFHKNRPAAMVPAMDTTPAGRARFEEAVAAITKLWQNRGCPPWPGILRDPGLLPGQLDELVREIGRRWP